MSEDTLLFRRASSFAAILLLSSLVSCALPPREAWRIVQTKGLIAYLNGDYSLGPNPQTRYLAYGAPLQPHHFYEQSGATMTYRPVYPSQRHLPAPPVSAPRTITPYTAPPATQPLAAAVPRQEPAAPRVVPPKPPSLAAPSRGPETTPRTPPAVRSIDDLPYGTAIAGRPGMVNSPFAQKQQLVDVTGMGVGQAVKCPYTGKLFRVPPTQQAGAIPPTNPAAKPDESATKPSSR